jgi:hypothetical protein
LIGRPNVHIMRNIVAYCIQGAQYHLTAQTLIYLIRDTMIP